MIRRKTQKILKDCRLLRHSLAICSPKMIVIYSRQESIIYQRFAPYKTRCPHSIILWITLTMVVQDNLQTQRKHTLELLSLKTPKSDQVQPLKRIWPL